MSLRRDGAKMPRVKSDLSNDKAVPDVAHLSRRFATTLQSAYIKGLRGFGASKLHPDYARSTAKLRSHEQKSPAELHARRGF
jgi:hypothetical protein